MSGKATMKNFKAMIAEARLPERTHLVCLRGDLVADHEAAERELERAQKDPIDSLAGSGIGELADRIQALETEMQDNSIEFRIRALPKSKFRALIVEHPPRRDPETNDILEADRFNLVNTMTFWDELLKQCTVEPELDDEDWLNLLGHNEEQKAKLVADGKADEIVEGALLQTQWNKLTDLAWAVNGNDVDIPFSLAASRAKRATAGE